MLADLRDQGVWDMPNNKVALIIGSIPYSVVIANAMKDAAPAKGFDIAFDEVVQTPTTEWGPVLAKVRKVNPGAIANTHFFAGDIAQCQVQFVENPTNSLFYYQYGALLKSFRDIAGDASVGAMTGTVDGLLSDDYSRTYVNAHKKKFGDEADYQPGGLSYGPMHHYALAAAIAGGTGEPGNDRTSQPCRHRRAGSRGGERPVSRCARRNGRRAAGRTRARRDRGLHRTAQHQDRAALSAW